MRKQDAHSSLCSSCCLSILQWSLMTFTRKSNHESHVATLKKTCIVSNKWRSSPWHCTHLWCDWKHTRGKTSEWTREREAHMGGVFFIVAVISIVWQMKNGTEKEIEQSGKRNLASSDFLSLFICTHIYVHIYSYI